MKFCLISSGSKGNCTYVQSKEAKILIDFGISKKKVLDAIKAYGVTSLDAIDNLLITHNHSDHIANIRYIPKDKWMIEFDNTKEELFDKQYITPLMPFKIKDMLITPLPLSHDSPSCVGFLIEADGERLCQITDTGYVPQKVLNLIKGCEYYVFESNHDTKMLYTSSRPIALIKRIHSDHGHMDNTSASYYLSNIIGSKTKEVYLAHLSEECNTPELAVSTFKTIYQEQTGNTINFYLACGSVTTPLYGGKDA